MADDLIDDLAHMNDLDLTWGFDLDPFLPERAQQAPAVGEVKPAAGHGRRSARLNGVRWTSPRPRQGALKPRRSVPLKEAR